MRRLLLIPLYRVPANPLSAATTYVAASYGVWQGVGLLTAEPRRISGPSYAMIRQSPELWGLAALVAGIAVAWGFWRKCFWLKAIALFVLATWSVAFATTSLHALMNSPVAVPTAPPAYYFIAVNLTFLIWADPRGVATPDATQNPAA